MPPAKRKRGNRPASAESTWLYGLRAVAAARRAFLAFRGMGLERRRILVDAMREAMLRDGQHRWALALRVTVRYEGEPQPGEGVDTLDKILIRSREPLPQIEETSPTPTHQEMLTR